MSIVRIIIRIKFALTSRKSATRLIREELARTLAVGDRLGAEGCGRSVRVPKLPGVDEDMREWTFYQILEHNVIVHRRIAGAVMLLAGDGPELEPGFDVKRDVMPQTAAGPEHAAALQKCVEDYLNSVGKIPRLRGTETRDHPLFGPFDAHRWHCMFGFHLQVHRKQAEALEKELRAE